MQTADWKLVLSPALAIYGKFWREARWALLGTSLVVLASSVVTVLAPYLFSRQLDALPIADMPTLLLWGFLAYAAIRGLATALGYGVNYLSIMAAEDLNFIAATAFFQRLLRKPVSFFIEHNPVEIQTARNDGQNAIYALAQLLIIVFIPGFAQILFSLGLLGTVINAQIVLIVIAYGLAFIVLTYFANHWTRPLLDEAIKAGQENAKFVGNAVNAMETLRYFNGDRWISTRFADKADKARAAWVAWSKRHIMLAVLFGSALALQLGITFTLLLPRYAAGEITVGDIVLINMLLVQLNQPFEMIGTAIDEVMRAYSKMLPFSRMWAAPEQAEADAGTKLDLQHGELKFENVSFSYADKNTVTDVSFTAHRGQVTFLVGQTGAGKSTLFKLALKALEPSAGRITIDGIDLAEIGRESWYDVVGIVPQEIMLLHDTIGANIVLGRPYDLGRLRRSVERASIAAFIDALPEGFETLVGERGLKLSGGERQRVAIARALYADPQMLLLDEASSALDEATEAQIMGELRGQGDRVTILAITHRRSLIGPHDNIVALAGGSAKDTARETSDEDAAIGQDGL